MRQLPNVRPYIAAGFGSYAYQETSDFAQTGDDVDTRHSGFVVNGGAEFRLHRWVGLAVDVQYSQVPGILGTGGVSQQAGESRPRRRGRAPQARRGPLIPRHRFGAVSPPCTPGV